MWVALESNFYNPDLKLWRRTVGHSKYRAVDHAILLLAAHKTLKCDHYQRTLSDTRRQYLTDLMANLVHALLHVFNYADPSSINTYIVIEEEHKSKHHASYVPQNNGQPATGSEQEPIKVKRFAWQDVWIALALHTLNVDVSLLADDIYETFRDLKSGVLFNEPRQNKRASWGGKLCNFTGDNALFYLLLNKLGRTDHPFIPAFNNLLGDLITDFEKYCYVAEAKQFHSPSLWASSELTFSLLVATGVEL